ncbi:glycosyltransferase family 4 protein [Halostella sp. JP-L12]|uniref:glycosyltransferase n=1 Tax=Halostella TaxID=1843185 RepID=UPI0013CF0F90|nr:MULTISPECIES: glycosyltransferase [Halostella]NHN46558.1 glycosyltransferase family 4 protein [Halostella sp. JP-L12]
MSNTTDPCLIFKPIEKIGGLERYVAELADTIDAPIYTPVQTVELPNTSSGRAPDVIEFRRNDWMRAVLDRAPIGAIVNSLEYEDFAVPDKHDTVITVSEAAKAVIQQPHQRRVHLLNMPPRWLFDLGPGRYNDAPALVGWLKRWYQSRVRVHDVSTVSRIEEFVVPSETIGERLRSYYSRTADHVIYPPVDTDRYYCEANGGYLLYVGRLAPAKRVVELVTALSGTEYRLQVAGTGPQEAAVREAAGPNVDVLGYVSEDEKRDLLANCDALVFNSDREAFGIVPVEALASGKPVVGIAEGFTKQQIQDGDNGVLFERGAENLREAVERMYDREWNANHIQESAQRYDVERFREAWREVCSAK